MRNPMIFLAVLGVMVLAGCTVKNTEAPALSGPSTFATSLSLSASPDSVLQDGPNNDAAKSTIRVVALGPDGRGIASLPLRVEIFVNGSAQDFGTILPASKTVTTDSTGGTQFYYYAPPRPVESVGTGTVVTITVIPVLGDYRGDMRRQVDIRVVPPGVILPPNGAPVASFVFTPTPIARGDTTTFDASATADEGVPCGARCTYTWNFGDGTSGAGMVTTHQFRTSGVFSVALTVTDDRATSHSVTQSVTVVAATPPTASFTLSPTAPAKGQTIFFNASASKPAANRSIVSYDWNFGDGNSASGVTATKIYDANGAYAVTLKVTDDVSEFAIASQTVTITNAVGAPTAEFDISPVAPPDITTATVVNFDAARSTPGASPIAKYGFNWGDGTTTNLIAPDNRASHRFAVAGTYVVRLTVEDTVGRSGAKVQTVVVK